MIARLVVWLILLACAGGGAVLVSRAALLRLDPGRRRRLEARRRTRELETRLGEVCVFCDRRVPRPDGHDDSRGWHHLSCLSEVVDDHSHLR